MPWAVAAAGVSAAAGLGSAAMQSSAVGGASKAQQQMAQLQRDDMRTWRDTGGQANTQAANLLGINGQDAADAAFGTFRASPGYQYALDSGLRAVDAGASAKGMLRSGATLQAEQKFGNDLANSDFSAYYNRLYDMSKTGASAAAGQGPTTNAAIQAAGQAGANEASIYGNTAKGISSSVNDLFSNPNFQNYLKGSGGGADPAYTAWLNPTSPGAYGPGF
jgi:hypothetical protein